MLSDFIFHTERRTEAECKALLKVRRGELAALQHRLDEAGLPVIVLLFPPVRAALADYTAQRRTGKDPAFRAETAGLGGKTECWN